MSKELSAISRPPSATPGPWKVIMFMKPGAVNSPGIVRQAWKGLDPHERFIATVSSHRSAAETEANAHLLAAAPDLLAACKQAVEFIDNGPGGTWIDAACVRVRAAIAKAEGKGTP